MSGPHPEGPPRTAGAPLDRARALVVLVHGRGASAESILTLAAELERPRVAFVAPQAAGSSWYPYSFLAPLERNEPGLSSGLATLAALADEGERAGIPAERQMLLGFSQGACLSLEFAARNARRYGGVAGLSGGLIGPDGTPRDYPGALEGTPIFLGCSDVDPHIPKARVLETAAVMEALGGSVTTRLYEGMGHLVNRDEIDFVRKMMEPLAA